jgi:transcriptional regulator with XRE-family HTH domain
MLNRPDRLHLSKRIRQVLQERGMANRDLITGLGERHVGTAYRLLAGTTSDPWISTVLEVCQALHVDPDELLEATRQPLEPELSALLKQMQTLPEEDRWLAVDLLRAIYRRIHRSAGE